METDEHIGKKFKVETNSGSFEILPPDYNNWSSTVIIFKEKEYEIVVFAFDSDDCVIYYVVNFPRVRSLIQILGYTAGDGKVFFVGKVYEQENRLVNSLAVQVYDISCREWITSDFPMLQAPKPKPFVFFFDSHLYVLSSAVSCDAGETHFEMVDINNFSQGWRFVDEPAFVWKDIWACHHDSIIDITENMVYIRLLEYSEVDCTGSLYCYKFRDKTWHTFDRLTTLTPRAGHMLKATWFNGSAIVEKFLYDFQMWRYPDGLRAILMIRDLEHPLEVLDSTLEYEDVDDLHSDSDPLAEGIAAINISDIVDQGVLHDLYCASRLVYVGNKNSCLRFSLILSYNCQLCNGDNHLSACTFDLTIDSTNIRQSTVVRVCCPPCLHINVGPGRAPLACHKLCHK